MPPEQLCGSYCASHVLKRYQKIGSTNPKTRLSEGLMSLQTRRCNINAVYNVESQQSAKCWRYRAGLCHQT